MIQRKYKFWGVIFCSDLLAQFFRAQIFRILAGNQFICLSKTGSRVMNWIMTSPKYACPESRRTAKYRNTFITLHVRHFV